jgi:phosphoenolpyruvate phosphomutase
LFSPGWVLHQFVAMCFSLCDSTAKGKPDIELVDMTSLSVHRRHHIGYHEAIIFDGDTGGKT